MTPGEAVNDDVSSTVSASWRDLNLAARLRPSSPALSIQAWLEKAAPTPCASATAATP